MGALEIFDEPEFRKVALVVMGEPPEEHKKRIQGMLLAEKKQKAVDDMVRKRAMDWKKKATDGREDNGEGDDMDIREEEDDDGKREKEGMEKKPDEDESLENAIKKLEARIELTEDEKNMWFRKSVVDDLPKKELGNSFGNFT